MFTVIFGWKLLKITQSSSCRDTDSQHVRIEFLQLLFLTENIWKHLGHNQLNSSLQICSTKLYLHELFCNCLVTIGVFFFFFYQAKWFPYSCVIISCEVYFSFFSSLLSLLIAWSYTEETNFPQEKKKRKNRSVFRLQREKATQTLWKNGSLSKLCGSTETKVGFFFQLIKCCSHRNLTRFDSF